MGRHVRAGRLIVKRTPVLQPSPGMEATRGQSQEPQECSQRHKRTGAIHGAQDPDFGASVGRRSCVNVNPELRSRVSARRRSAVSFLTRRRSSRISCSSSDAFRFVTSRLTTTFGALRSQSRAVESGTRDPWRWLRPRCRGRDSEADGRSAVEGAP
jgi:hypothetical protein